MKIADLAAGVTVGGRYRLVDILGRGGYGDVWEAIRLSDDAQIALKVYHEQDRGNRFLFQEAKQAIRFRHPRLVQVYGAERIDGIYCMEMELVPGPTLAKRLGDLERPLYVPLQEAVEWMEQVADGLAYLHGLNPPVSHGDLKPENLIVSPHDGIKLMDFGHSREIEDQLVATVGGGTWLYIAPEILGRSERFIASDIYSFGVVFYRVLTGRFPRQTLGEVYNLTPFPRPCELNSSIPPELDSLLLRCLERQPIDRYSNAGDLRRALAEIKSGLITQAPAQTVRVGQHSSRAQVPHDHLEVAHRLAARQDFDGALAEIETVMGQISTRREILFLYGHLAEQSGRLQVALKTFERLVRWMRAEGAPSGEQREALVRLGNLQVRLKDFEGAVTSFETLHSMYPEDLWLAYKYGIALGLVARFKESITILAHVRQRRPDLASVPAKIGFAYLQLKEPKFAAQYFNEALMLDEFEAHALYYLALIRAIEGRTERAMTYYHRLQESDDGADLAQDLGRKLGMHP